MKKSTKVLKFFGNHIWVLGLVAAIAAAIMIQGYRSFRSKAGPGPVSLIIVPPTQNKNVNETGTVAISMNPNGAQVSSVELVLTYDSNLIEVQNISPGNFFTSIASNPLEIIKDLSTPGKIHYALSFPLGSVALSSTSLGDAAVITFLAKSQGTGNIGFVTDESVQPHTLIADINANNVFGTAFGGSVNIAGGAGLYFSDPVPTNLIANDSFTLQALMNTGGQNVSGLDAKITFNPAILSVVDLDQGGEGKLLSYPTLTFDNSTGSVSISANVGTSAGATALNGDGINFGRIVFRAKQATTGSDIVYSYIPGSKNDSNIVLWGTQANQDPVDILSQVTAKTIIVSAQTPTPSPTNPPTTPPTPSPSPTPPPVTPTPTPINQIITMRLGFQGRITTGISKIFNLMVRYKNSQGQEGQLGSVMTNSLGEATITLPVGIYSLILDTNGYLARKFPNTSVVQGNWYLDLSSNPLYGGDFNNDGEINEVDYTIGFLPAFQTNATLYDLDGSGEVNTLDYEVMRKNWSMVDDEF